MAPIPPTGNDAFAAIVRNYPRILIPLAAASRPSSSYVALSRPISPVYLCRFSLPLNASSACGDTFPIAATQFGHAGRG